MSFMPNESDPYYDHPAAAWIRDMLSALTNYQVLSDDSLGNRTIEIDMPNRKIKIRPGLSPVQFHSVAGQAGLYIIGGAAWAPIFRRQPRLRLIDGEE